MPLDMESVCGPSLLPPAATTPALPCELLGDEVAGGNPKDDDGSSSAASVGVGVSEEDVTMENGKGEDDAAANGTG